MHTPVCIKGAEEEKIEGFMFLGVNITSNLSGINANATMARKCSPLSLLPQMVKEIQHVSNGPELFPQMHHRYDPL